MKTFKIVALQVAQQPQFKNIPLKDGLIINKENADRTWVIEAFVDQIYKDIFQAKYEHQEIFEIRVIITHPANDPAPFSVKILKIREIGENISVLFEGVLVRQRNEYPELLLGDLIKEGYSGDELLNEFKKRMKIREQ